MNDLYKRPAELLQDLIRFDTTNPPGNEMKCIQYIDDLLSSAGFEATILSKDANRPNLITRLKGGNADPLLLFGHVDVVTTADQKWTYPPFEGILKDEYIWGRGALDMKGGVAMMLSALIRAKTEQMKPAGDVTLAILSDEENFGNYGAKFLAENHPDQFKGIRYAISEFGGFSSYVGKKKFYPIMVDEKRLCHLRATVHGPAGHGMIPMHGGAMTKLSKLLCNLDEHKLPAHVTSIAKRMTEDVASSLGFPSGLILRLLTKPSLTDSVLRLLGERASSFDPLFHNTVNATVVQGGYKHNVIPSEIAVDLDCRLLPGFTPESFINELRQIIGDEAELEIVRFDAGPAEPNFGLFNLLEDIMRAMDSLGKTIPLMLTGSSDARFFSRLGIQTYGFLPMNLPPEFDFIKTVHAADERIPVEALTFGASAIYELLRRFNNN